VGGLGGVVGGGGGGGGGGSELVYWSASVPRDAIRSPKPLGREDSNIPLLKLKLRIIVFLFPNCLCTKILGTLEVYLATIPVL